MYGFLFDNYSINEKWVAMHIASYCRVCTHACSFQCKYEQDVITIWNLIADFEPWAIQNNLLLQSSLIQI